MKKTVSILFALVLALSLSLVMAVPVSAATITTATPTDIPVDPDYTALTNPAIAEGGVAEILVGTITLTAPAGFKFDIASDVTATVTAGDLKLLGGLAAQTVTPTASTITINVATVSTIASTITYTGIKIGDTDHATGTTGDLVFSGGAGVAGNAGTLTSVAGPATKFVILDPTDGTVDAAITVTVEAQDQYSNICDSGPNIYAQDVTLVTDGSATGAGLVDIIAGTGSLPISDHVAETVNLTLDDTEGTLLDCTSTQDVIFAVGAIDHYAVSAINAYQVAGTPFNVTIQAQDQYNNNITAGGGSAENINITFGLPDAWAAPTTTATVAGTATVNMTMTVAQTGQSITFTGVSTKAGTSNAFTVILQGSGGAGAAYGSGSMSLNLYLDGHGRAIADISLTSTDGLVTMGIHWGTLLLDAQGNRLEGIEINILSTPPPPPGYALVGHAYDCLPDGATFQPDILLTFRYRSVDVPDGVSEQGLVLAYWDGGDWINLPTHVNAANNIVTARVAHFTPFAILAYTGAPAFGTSDLSITPAEVDVGEEVAISLLVANSGDCAGSYEVTLEIDDVAVATEAVTLAAGASERVTFATAKDVAGTYTVSAGGLSGTFVVKEEAPILEAAPPPAEPPPEAPPAGEETNSLNIWVIVGIIAAVIVVVLFAVTLGRRRA